MQSVAQISRYEFASATAPKRSPARTVWLQVIAFAIEEYRKPPRDIRDRVDAAYFSSPDFTEVCGLAGVDPDYVRRIINAKGGPMRIN